MKQFFINKNSNKLIIFFTGWGCDEYEFEHLEADCDVLMFYDYSNLDYNFDFSKYTEINLLSFSAGVFAASVLDFDFKINKKIAISGNPFLFDEKFGLSKEIQEVLCSITEENADDFAINYLIKTDAEREKFHHSKRTLEGCLTEFEKLKELYKTNKDKIKDIYDSAYIGENDPMLNISAQKEFYKDRLHVIKNARHNIFFRINSYRQILETPPIWC